MAIKGQDWFTLWGCPSCHLGNNETGCAKLRSPSFLHGNHRTGLISIVRLSIVSSGQDVVKYEVHRFLMAITGQDKLTLWGRPFCHLGNHKPVKSIVSSWRSQEQYELTLWGCPSCHLGNHKTGCAGMKSPSFHQGKYRTGWVNFVISSIISSWQSQSRMH